MANSRCNCYTECSCKRSDAGDVMSLNIKLIEAFCSSIPLKLANDIFPNFVRRVTTTNWLGMLKKMSSNSTSQRHLNQQSNFYKGMSIFTLMVQRFTRLTSVQAVFVKFPVNEYYNGCFFYIDLQIVPLLNIQNYLLYLNGSVTYFAISSKKKVNVLSIMNFITSLFSCSINTYN